MKKYAILSSLFSLLASVTHAETILSADFTGRTVSGDTASNITYTLNGLSNPGDLSVYHTNGAAHGGSLFDTTDSQGFMAHSGGVNDSPPRFDIPLILAPNLQQISLAADDTLEIDFTLFTSGGNVRGNTKTITWTIDLIGSTSGTVLTETQDVGPAISGKITAFDGKLATLSADETWTIVMKTQQYMSESNTRVGISGYTLEGTPGDYSPTFTTAGDQTIDEGDGAQSVTSFIGDFNANDVGQSLVDYTVAVTSGSELFSAQPDISNDGTLSYTPKNEASGTATVTVYATDDGVTNNQSTTHSFDIIINQVNYIPTFNVSSSHTSNEDTGAKNKSNFVSDFDANDSEQSLVDYTVTVTSGASLFSVLPDVNNSRKLTYTLADDVSGTATVEIYATDDGSDNNQSITKSFSIIVNEVNDEPSVTVAGDVSGVPGVAFSQANFSTFDTHEAGQSISSVIVTADDPSLFTVQPAIATDGTLTFTAANGGGSTTVTVQAVDDGGTSNGGVDTSAEQTFTITTQTYGTVVYVDADTPAALGAQDGASWSTAYASLSAALNSGVSNAEIWVADGVYYADDSDSSVSLTVGSNLYVRAGFTGSESSFLDADPETNLVIVSGDIDNNDTKDANGITLSYADIDAGSGNTKCLMRIESADSSVINGVTFTAGKDGVSNNGAAVLIDSSTNIRFENCAFRGNQAGSGGAIYQTGGTSSVSVDFCQFYQNNATIALGGAVQAGGGNLTIYRSEFRGNNAVNGGGVSLSAGASLEMDSCLLSGNVASTYGGALLLSSTADLTNLTIAHNSATFGGGLTAIASQVDVTNSILWGNGADPVEFISSPTLSWKNSLVEGSGGSSAWMSSFGTDNDGNLDEDPHFTNPTAVTGAPFITGDYTFGNTSSSPGRNAGSNSDVILETDILGSSRRNGTVDMGAYEENSALRPTFTTAGDQTVLEDSGAASIANVVTSFDPVGAGESLLGYTVTYNNSSLFAVAPTIDTSGTLTFTPADNQNGTSTLTIYAFDDGDSFSVSNALTLKVIVTAVNDAPSFSVDTDIRVELTTDVQTYYDFAYNIDTFEDGQSYSFALSNFKSSMFSAGGQPAIDADGTLTFQLADTDVDYTPMNVKLQDDGGTADGGDDSVTIAIKFYASHTNSYGIQGAGFHSEAYAELGALVVAAGESITIDTDSGSVSGDVSFSGAVLDYAQDGEQYRVFNFSDVSIAAGATVTIRGDYHLALTSTGDISIEADMNLDGDVGESNGAPEDGESGTDGKGLAIVAKDTLTLAGNISSDGGTGGVGGDEDDPESPSNGGDGGKGGAITLGANTLTFTGTITARGGNGGNGGAGSTMNDGNGGDGGDGGSVTVINNAFEVSGYDVSAGAGGTGHNNGSAGTDGTQLQDQTPGYLRDVIYVDHEAEGDNNGATWNDAFRDLQEAIDSASAGDQIWVAAGRYVPTGDETDRDASFELKSGVSLYGGFYGGASSIADSDVEKSPWAVNLAGETSIEEADPYRSARFTVLSGDIDLDDTVDRRFTTRYWNEQRGSNSHNVVTADGVSNVLIDGFFFSAGNCGNGEPGAALRSINSSLTLKRCLFRGNRSDADGAGVFASSDSTAQTIDMEHCIFLTNYAANNGACVMVGANTTVNMVRVDIHGNQAGNYGAALQVENGGTAVLENAVIAGNKANLDRGAISVDAGNLTLLHTTITGNAATSNSGTKTGGVYLANGSTLSSINSALWRNANNSFQMDSSTASWTNSLIASSGSSSSWDSSFGTDAGGNIDEDPLFEVDLDPSLAPTLDGNLGGSVSFFPLDGSPLIDAGTNTGPFSDYIDADGNGRISNGLRDIGACEYQTVSESYYAFINNTPSNVADLDSLFSTSGLTYGLDLAKQDVVEAYISGGKLYTLPMAEGGTQGRSTYVIVHGSDGSGVVETITVLVALVEYPSFERSGDGTTDTFTFNRPTANSWVFTPQYSSDLVNWHSVYDLMDEQAILSETKTEDSNYEEVVLEIPGDTQEKRFYRLHAERPVVPD